MLKISNVTKTFGKIRALDDVSLDVDKGEFMFITGPSGAGKTTLLRLILRDLVPDKGKILFEGKDIVKLPGKDVPSLRQKIGFVFQDFKVLPERTLRENVEVVLAVTGVPREEWKGRVNQVLEQIGLAERSEFFPSQLSGGELQRVSLARALAVNPKVILADEPTGNLDWDTSNELMELFQKINKKGKTIIMATHHKLIVGKLGKRAVELKDGRIVGGEPFISKIKKSKKPKPEKEVDVKEEKRRVKIKVEETENN